MAKSGKVAIGISSEDDQLHVAKLDKTKYGVRLLNLVSYQLPQISVNQLGASPEEANFEDAAGFLDAGDDIDFDSDSDEALVITEDDLGSNLDLAGFEQDLDGEKQDDLGDSNPFMVILKHVNHRNTKVALSLSEPQIFHSMLYTAFRKKGNKGKPLVSRLLREDEEVRARFPDLKVDDVRLVPVSKEQSLAVMRQRNPYALELLDQAASFSKHYPKIAFIESVEVSLINWMTHNYDFEDGQSSLIIHVEQGSSRFIFMSGKEVTHITPLINEGSDNPRLAKTLYSRVLFELDSMGLTRLDAIYCSGMSRFAGILEYFQGGMTEETKIENISFDKIAIPLSETFSPDDIEKYAPAISAAYRALGIKWDGMLPVNLTPMRIRDRQNPMALTPLALVFLALIPAISYYSIHQIDYYQGKIIELKNALQQEQAANSEYLAVEAEIDKAHAALADFERTYSVVDSLTIGSVGWAPFLDRLMGISREINYIWFTEITTVNKDSVNLKGYSLFRNRVPDLVTEIGGAELQQVEVQEIRGKTVYKFDILAVLPRE